MSKKKENADDERFTTEVGQTFEDAGLMDRVTVAAADGQQVPLTSEEGSQRITEFVAAAIDAPDGPPTASDEKPDPTPEPDLQTRFDALSLRMSRILKCRTRLGKKQNAVEQREQEKKSADAELKAAIGDRDLATRELERVIDDDKAGQQPLPGVEEQLDAPETTEQVASSGTDWPLSVLGTTALRGVLGGDVIEQQKAIEDPIGLTETQLDKLASACESNTLAGLEKWIAADAWWHQKIKGFGEKAIQRVVSTLTAFRRAKPMQVEAERPPTILEALASSNEAANVVESQTETKA